MKFLINSVIIHSKLIIFPSCTINKKNKIRKIHSERFTTIANVDRIQLFYSTVSVYFMSASWFGSRQSSPSQVKLDL
jgi:hypothetical protein